MLAGKFIAAVSTFVVVGNARVSVYREFLLIYSQTYQILFDMDEFVSLIILSLSRLVDGICINGYK